MDNEYRNRREKKFSNHRRSGHPKHTGSHGVLLIVVGVLLLFYRIPELNALFPSWLFTWPMILVIIGLFVGIKQRFNDGLGWLIPIVIGVLFLLKMYFPENLQSLLLPIIVIAIGIIIFFNRRCFTHRHMDIKMRKCSQNEFSESSSEDFVNLNSTFGSIEKNILSKKFKGGNIICSFGGAEIDLRQSDIEETAVLDFSVTFGGAKLSIPSNWKVQNDVRVVFGGIEDKRRNVVDANESKKTIILTGNITFGGLEIKN